MRPQRWRKSSFSDDGANGGGTCIEVTLLPDGQIGLRDSKQPEAGHLVFTRAEIAAWVKGVKAGEFDDLC